MNIFNFTQCFPDEDACMMHFKAQREQNGVICPKCGSKAHYWLRNKLSTATAVNRYVLER